MVIDGMGTLMVFGDETMSTKKASFNLSKLSLDNFRIQYPNQQFPAIRVELREQTEGIDFVFETAREHREFMQIVVQCLDSKDDLGAFLESDLVGAFK